MNHAWAKPIALTALLGSVACGQNGPPRHPVGEIAARATAKLDVVDLVVSDPERARRLRAVYIEMWKLGHEYDLARARSLRQARDAMHARSNARSGSTSSGAALERMLVPPLDVGRAAFERYTALTLEARSLLSEDEFEALEALR